MNHEQMRMHQMLEKLKRDYTRMYGNDGSFDRSWNPYYNTQQSSYGQEQPLTMQQEMLLDLFDEFVSTPDGKALASGLTRFARYVQSKTDRASQQ